MIKKYRGVLPSHLSDVDMLDKQRVI